MGRLMGMMGASSDSSATVAIKGTRMSRMDNNAGQIIDLGAETITQVDIKKKEYRVMTFAEMREQWKKMQADLEKQRQQMKPEEKQALEDAGKQLEFTADVKETGARKNIAGHEARQVILTITGHREGQDRRRRRRLRADQRHVARAAGSRRSTSWPVHPQVREGRVRRELRRRHAADGGRGHVFPSLKPMMEKLQAERGKLRARR